MKTRKILAIFMAIAMVFSYMPTIAFSDVAVDAPEVTEETGGALVDTTEGIESDFEDMPTEGFWSTKALKAAVNNGLLNGFIEKNGIFIKPDDSLTRAQMATIVNRGFGAVELASLMGVTDVSADAWYSLEIQKAVKMGTLKLDKLMRPDDTITRQEAFTVLGRALKMNNGIQGDLANFNDASLVANWAIPGVGAMVKAGYIQGDKNLLAPTASMTRAEFATIMDNVIKEYITTAGTIKEVVDGNVMINVPGVTLENITITGNLIIGDGVADGNVTLKNVLVKGDLIARGGGIDSIVITGGSVNGKVIIAKIDGKIRVFAEDGAEIEIIEIDDGKDDVIIEGTVGTVEVTAADTPIIVRNATVTKIEVKTEGPGNLTVEAASKVDSVIVGPTSTGTKVKVTGEVRNFETSAANTALSGTGKVTDVRAKEGADGSSVTTPNTKITNDGALGLKGGGGSDIPANTSTSNNAQGTGTTGTSGSSGGGSSIAVSDISADEAFMLVKADENEAEDVRTIAVTVNPENASNKNLIWSSENEDIASVDNKGVVTGLKAGRVNITATSAADSGKKAKIQVIVGDVLIPAHFTVEEIQTEIANTDPGKTIAFPRKEFQGNLTIDKPLTLLAPIVEDKYNEQGQLIDKSYEEHCTKIKGQLAVAADNVKIDGFAITHPANYREGISDSECYYDMGISGSGIVIKNCSFYGGNNEGENNFFATGEINKWNMVNGIGLANASSNITIDNCSLYGIYHDAITSWANSVTIENSSITGCKSGINIINGDLDLINTTMDVTAVNELKDTYGVKFAGNNMTITGGTIVVYKDDKVAVEGIYHSAIVIREGARGNLAVTEATIYGEVIDLSEDENFIDSIVDESSANKLQSGWKVTEDGHKILIDPITVAVNSQGAHYEMGAEIEFTIKGLHRDKETKVYIVIHTGPGGYPWAAEEEVIDGMMPDEAEANKYYWKGTTNSHGELIVTGMVQGELPYGTVHIRLPEYDIGQDNAIQLHNGRGMDVTVGGEVADRYVLAQDEDFSGEVNGEFRYTGSAEYVEIPHVIKGVPLTSYYCLFENTFVKGVKSYNQNITDMTGMFSFTKSSTLDLSSFNTSATTNMHGLFFGSQVGSLDLSAFDTSRVTNMSGMFVGSQVSSLDLRGFDTSNVEDMSEMFTRSEIVVLNISGFDTSKVTDMNAMFAASQSTVLDVSGFNTSNVRDMKYMFDGSQVGSLDLSGFNTWKVTDMGYMFRDSQVTSLDLSSFDTLNVTNMAGMFENSQVTSLDLSSFDTSNVESVFEMFAGSQASTGYARTQEDADRFNASSDKPVGLTFIVQGGTDRYVLAQDEDFSGEINGEFRYTGSAEYVEIPHVIKGVPVTSYKNMFKGTTVKGVKSDNIKITDMSRMFYESKAT